MLLEYLARYENGRISGANTGEPDAAEFRGAATKLVFGPGISWQRPTKFRALRPVSRPYLVPYLPKTATTPGKTMVTVFRMAAAPKDS